MTNYMIARTVDSIVNTVLWMDDISGYDVVLADAAPIHTLVQAAVDMIAVNLEISSLAVLYFCGVKTYPDEIPDDIKNDVDQLEKVYLNGKEKFDD